MIPIIRKTRSTLARIFLRGLVVILPIAITISLIAWLVTAAESFLGGLVQAIFPEWNYWPGLGTLLGIVLVFVMGLFVNAWIARNILAQADAIMSRIPVVKSIYGGLRDLTQYMSSAGERTGFHQVVIVSVTEQMRLIGFVTRQDFSNLPQPLGTIQELVGVYLPMSYQIGGYTIYVPKSTLQTLDMSVEDAMRFTLTAGMSNADSAKASILVPQSGISAQFHKSVP